MDLSLVSDFASSYSSRSQKIRVMTELWLQSNQFCPACGCFPLKKFQNNRPVADFLCIFCNEQYELKSQKRKIGRTVADGAYRTMIERITSNENPNFLFLSYDDDMSVNHLQLVPKHFLSVQAIAQRKPLSASAQRAGWQGCNILMDEIAAAGRITLIRNGQACPKAHILRAWKNTIFVRYESDSVKKSWLLNVMRCIDHISQSLFTLDDVYNFESELGMRFPANHNVRPKIRQQLQVLRDNGYIAFLGGGNYAKIK